MTNQEKELQRYYAGLTPRAPDEPDPCPAAHRPLPLREQREQRRLALLDHIELERPKLTEAQRRSRKLAGLTEDYSSYPPAVAIKGDGVFAPSNSRVDGPNASGYYSSGHLTGLTQPGGQSPGYSAPSPDPEQAAGDRLRQALDVCKEALRLRKPLYRAAVQFCCDQVEFAVDLNVNGWVAPDDTFIGAANVYATLRDALADNGELDLAQTAEVAAQLTSALAALRGEEQAERTVAPAQRRLLTEQASFQVLEVAKSERHNDLTKVRGILMTGDSVNSNNRIYRSSLLKRECARISKQIADGRTVFALSDHPKDGTPLLQNAAAVWDSVAYDPKTKQVTGTATILGTRAGSDLLACVRAGAKVGISARGHGNTIKEGDHEVVDEATYSLSSWDFVIGQSFVDSVAEPIA